MEKHFEKALHNHFIFCKKIPVHLYSPSKYTDGFLVSPFSFKTCMTLLNILNKDDYRMWGIERSKKENGHAVELHCFNDKTIIRLYDGGRNPVFRYLNRYAFLGGILGYALKNLNENLILNDHGLWMRRKKYVTDNHKAQINEELVTEDFQEILNAFELPISELARDQFSTSLDYYKFLNTSPYLNLQSLSKLEKCDIAFLRGFYQYLEVYSEKETKQFTEDSWKNFHRFELAKFEKNYDYKLKVLLDHREKYDFNALYESVKEIESDKNKVGKIFSKFRANFKTHKEFKDFVQTNSKEVLLEKIRSFTLEKLSFK